MCVLTVYQEKILRLISEGYTSEEIGNKVFKSPRTIEGVRKGLINLTKTKNTAHLIAYALRNGLLI